MINNSVLVTGSAGFIGTDLCRYLLSKGRRVIGVDYVFPHWNMADPSKKRSVVSLSKNPNFVFRECNISDEHHQLLRILKEEKPKSVIHLAGSAGVTDSTIYPLEYEQNNVGGTLSLLEAIVKSDVERLVFASSSSVYGDQPSYPSKEDARLYPKSIYAATKVACEALCHSYHSIYGLDIICLRLFSVYGERQRADLVISKFTRSIMLDGVIRLFDHGNCMRDYTHVSDVCRAFECAEAMYNKSGFEIINIGSSMPISTRDLMEKMFKILGREVEFTLHDQRKEDVKITHADITRARKRLGWSPVISLDDGLKSYLLWRGLDVKENP